MDSFEFMRSSTPGLVLVGKTCHSLAMTDAEIDRRQQEFDQFLESGSGNAPAELFVDPKRPMTNALRRLAADRNLIQFKRREIDQMLADYSDLAVLPTN